MMVWTTVTRLFGPVQLASIVEAGFFIMLAVVLAAMVALAAVMQAAVCVHDCLFTAVTLEYCGFPVLQSIPGEPATTKAEAVESLATELRNAGFVVTFTPGEDDVLTALWGTQWDWADDDKWEISWALPTGRDEARDLRDV